MTDFVEVIKNQFFSQENMNFIMKIVTSKNMTTSHQALFNASNQIFNNFIHTVYTQKKSVNPNKIEDLLITLNKMVIDVILDNPTNTKEQKQDQEQHQEQEQTQQEQEQEQEVLEDIVESPIHIPDSLSNLQNNVTIHNTSQNIVRPTQNEFLYIFSEDCEYNNSVYKLKFNQQNVNAIKLQSFELLNDLYNITEYNNKFEITEKTIKKNISIPIGCYNLIDLLTTMEKCILEKIKDSKITIKYNQHKNRIYINSDTPFSFHFIENDNMFIPLRFMLGFDKKEYMNNNNYCSNKEPALNIYDNIYIKILTLEELNKNICQNFKFYDRLNFNQIQTFGNVINITPINNTIYNMDIDNLSIEFYYRHMTHRKFYRINERLKFTLIFDVCKFI